MDIIKKIDALTNYRSLKDIVNENVKRRNGESGPQKIYKV